MKVKETLVIGVFVGIFIGSIIFYFMREEEMKNSIARGIALTGWKYENDFERRLMSLPSIGSELYTASSVAFNINGDIFNKDQIKR